MSRLFRTILAGGTLLLSVSHSAGAQAVVTTSEIARLQWLSGCWAQHAPGRVTEEQWMAPRGGTMVGISRTVVRDTTRSWEFLRIAHHGDRLAYVATPSGQAETVFPVVSITDTVVTFENPQHDFPQRISYRRIRADSVVAMISGTVNGRTRGSSFPMVRTRCTGT